MATVIMNIYKGQRMDITAQMKDADKIIELFRKYSIHFDKKFTSINNGPSTITFKGLKAENLHSDLTDMVVECHQMAKSNDISNVYVRFTSFMNPKFMKEKEKPNEEPKEPEKTAETDDTL